MSHLLLKCLAVSVAVVTLANLTLGTYFEHYESVLNAFVVGEFTALIDHTFFEPVWFMAFALFSHTAHATGSAHVYGAFMSLFTILTLTALLYSFQLLTAQRLRPAVRLWAMGMLLLLYMDNVVHLHNQRISFFAIIAAAMLFAALRQADRPAYQYLSVLMLCGLGILARLEVAIIASLVVVVAGLLFQGRAFRAFAFALLIACTSVFTFYHAYQTAHYPNNALILQSEQEFEDRFTISPNRVEDADDRLIVGAMCRYIQDGPIFGADDYRRLVCNQNLADYLSGPDLLPAYQMKLQTLWQDLEGYRWLILFTLLTTLITVIHLVKAAHRQLALKLVLLVLSLVGVPMLINVYGTTPYSFVAALLLFANGACLLLLSMTAHHRTWPMMLLLGTALVLGDVHHSVNIHRREQEKLVRAVSVRAVMAQVQAMGSQVVMMNGTHYDFYPARLFNSLYEPRIEHHYVDHFLGSFNMISEHSEQFFGGDYTSLLAKLSAIANREDMVVVEASMGQSDDFYGPYMRHFHGKDVSFVPHPQISSTSPDVNAYLLVMHDARPQPAYTAPNIR